MSSVTTVMLCPSAEERDDPGEELGDLIRAGRFGEQRFISAGTR